MKWASHIKNFIAHKVFRGIFSKKIQVRVKPVDQLVRKPTLSETFRQSFIMRWAQKFFGKDKLINRESIVAFLQLLRKQNPITSLGMQLFLMVFIAIVGTVLISGMASYFQSKDLIKSKVSDSGAVAISQTSGKLDLFFKNLETLTFQIVLDPNIRQNISELAKTDVAFDRLTYTKNIEESLQSYLFGNEQIQNISLVPVVDNIPTISTGIEDEELKNQKWFSKVQELDGQTLWIPVQLNGLTGSSQDSFAVARLIKNLQTSEVYYMLVVEINSEAFKNLLGDVKLGVGSNTYITDESNKVVYSANSKMIGKKFSIKVPKKNQGSMETSYKDTDVLAVYHKFKITPWSIVGTVPVDALVEDAKVIRTMTWVIALIAAILAGLIGWLIVYMIARPIRNLRDLMKQGTDGNLSVRSVVSGKNEVAQLSTSFNDMMDQLNGFVQQTSSSSDFIADTAEQLSHVSRQTSISAKEISTATDDIAKGANNLATEAERGMALTDQINDNMQRVLQDNHKMSEAAEQVEQASIRGATQMGELIHNTEQTEQMVKAMMNKVSTLKENAGSITQVLTVLQGITKQTTILALNASIEATRAGVAGRGFMVVADEIRKLAEQSRQSISTVGQITVDIQNQVDNTVQALEMAYPLFQQQIISVKDASTIFEQVQVQMGDFNDQLQSVVKSITVLDQSQKILADAMTNVSAVAEQSSAASEEVASLSSEQSNISTGLVSLSEQLKDVSESLAETLNKFKA